MQAIIQKYEDLIRWLVKYSKPESIRYENYCNELSDLKKQLEECKDGECKNCKYENIDGDMRPCKDCFTGFYTNWEPINE